MTNVRVPTLDGDDDIPNHFLGKLTAGDIPWSGGTSPGPDSTYVRVDDELDTLRARATALEETAAGLGDAATRDVGIGAGDVAAGNTPAAAASAATSALTSVYVPLAGNATVFLGDSITLASDLPDGSGGSGPRRCNSWPVYASILTSQRLRYIRNAGVYGNTTTQMLSRFDTDVTPYAPNVVTLLAGTNDCSASFSLPTTSANIRAIVAKIRAIGARPILFTIPPTTNTIPANRSQIVSTLNAWIRGYAATSGIPLIDVYALLIDATTGGMQSAYDGGDGIHPGGAGYLAIATEVAAKIDGLGIPARRATLAGYNTDPNNLVTNGLFLSGASGDPTGWSLQNTSGVTRATVPADAGDIGNWWQATASGSSGNQILYQNIASMTAGHRYRLAARIKSTGANVSTWYLLLRPKDGSGNGLGDFHVASAITQNLNGVCEIEFAAPATTTNGQIQVIVGPSTAVVMNIGQVTLNDLTSMGVVDGSGNIV